MTITIYHNPDCETSRNTLAMIVASGESPRVVEYLKTPPGREKLSALITAAGLTPCQLLRQKGTPYDELGLADLIWTDSQLVDFMLIRPILINRPLVETPLGTKLCRPSETVLQILPNPHFGAFAKEDGGIIDTDKPNRK